MPAQPLDVNQIRELQAVERQVKRMAPRAHQTLREQKNGPLITLDNNPTETAKANGLSPHGYRRFVFEALPTLGGPWWIMNNFIPDTDRLGLHFFPNLSQSRQLLNLVFQSSHQVAPKVFHYLFPPNGE